MSIQEESSSLVFNKISAELNHQQISSPFQEEFEEVPEKKLSITPAYQIEDYEYEDQEPLPITSGFAEANNTLKAWWLTLQADRAANYNERAALYEKALVYLSGCYKVWYHYLKESVEEAKKFPILSKKYEEINRLFERALSFLHKMPRIWLVYCDFLIHQRLITKTRNIFDKALISLPASQHEKIWAAYNTWALKLDSIATAKGIMRRYLRINPDFKEDYLEYLLQKEEFDEAAVILKEILDDDRYASNSDKSKYQFLMQLCELISKHPDKIVSLDCEAVIQHGISKYTDEIGNLWVCLADYFIRQGLFQKARDVFDEALANILTARDFGIVFNAYVKFEEEFINMISQEDNSEKILNSGNSDSDLRKTINKILSIDSDDQEVDVNATLTEDYELDYRIDRLEKLLDKRPLYLNDCLLRQNKNNVNEWLKRLTIVNKEEKLYLKTISEAISQIDPKKAENGLLSDIWVKFAAYYQKYRDIKNANLVYHKASQVSFKSAEDLSNIWLSWAEMLINEGFYSDALSVVKNALFSKKQPGELSESLSLNLSLWTLYLDLERNLGTFETINEAYKRMLNLKVITPFLLLNYANFLEENKYFEESFKVYEQGINLFNWPSLYEIWLVYLYKFVERYQGDCVERTRDLFEKALENIPNEFCKVFYLMFADFEEKYGLLNHAIEILDQLVLKAKDDEKKQCYQLYIAKVAEFLGVTKARPIFESALCILKNDDLIEIGHRFAELEKKLGEIDRVRAIYIHVSQFCDPNFDKNNFWKNWENFELRHGNIDTYKEYKKVWRSVLGKFSLSPPDVAKIMEQVKKEQNIDQNV